MGLADYGITTTTSGQVRTQGGEVHVPRELLNFLDTSAPEKVHLPGSEDGYPEVFSREDFEQYVRDMIE